MLDEDREILEEFVIESRELLEQAETELLSLDTSDGSDPDPELINRIFRAVHSVKGAAGFFGLESINRLSHSLESVLMKVREGTLTIDRDTIDVFLEANDRLRDLIGDVENSNRADIEASMQALEPFLTGAPPPPKVASKPTVQQAPQASAEPQSQEQDSSQSGSAEETATAPETNDSVAPGLSEERRQDLLRHGQKLYRLQVSIDEDLTQQNRTVEDFLAKVRSLGDVVHVRGDAPGLPAIPESPGPGTWLQCFVATVLSQDLAAFGFDVQPKHISAVDLKQGDSQAEPTAQSPTKPAGPAEAPSKKPTAAQPPKSAEDKATVAQPQGAANSKTESESKTSTKRSAKPPAAKSNKGTTAAGKISGPSAEDSETALKVDETVRVKTSVLNVLMEMAGEMVLARNRLVRWLEQNLENAQGVGSILHEVSSITTSLQEEIMRMRLHPVGTLFNKFHRVVRDLSRKLGKEVVLTTHGEDVELDRNILEGLSDPLTHLVRNCLDHGIESPAQREADNKTRRASINLRAFHQNGMVNIEVEDDGKGLNLDKLREKALLNGLISDEKIDQLTDREVQHLVFAPGFSTAKEVTDISGRGVGMDVVRTNIEKLGGTVDIVSVEGKGTTVCLKLPLTLAIVSSLIVEAAEQRFALPQVGLEEVIRLKAGESSQRIEKVRGSDILRHRGRLLPLLRLSSVLGLQGHYLDAESGDIKPDRRQRIADRRSESTPRPEDQERRTSSERRISWGNVQRILVLRIGANLFGLIVDKIIDNEEIVVKPLSQFVRDCPCFSGATILGDGRISMILDPLGIAQSSNLRFEELATVEQAEMDRNRSQTQEQLSLLIFSAGSVETFGMPLSQIERVEKITTDSIEVVGSKEYIEYQGTTLPLVRLHNYLPVQPPENDSSILYIIIPKLVSQPMGIVTHGVQDSIDLDTEVDQRTIRSAGLLGSALLNNRIVLLLDIFSLFELVDPANSLALLNQARQTSSGRRALIVEDTPFYRLIQQDYLEGVGFDVEYACNGEEAWKVLEGRQFDVVLTDLVMPQLDGRGLLERIRNSQLGDLPVIAASSLVQEQQREASLQAGFDGHVVKLDRDGIVASISTVLAGRSGGEA